MATACRGWPCPHRATCRRNLDFSIIRPNQQSYSDGHRRRHDEPVSAAGKHHGHRRPVWFSSWEDDLIMTGVRSFDVKAYDNSLAGYADLGWGDDLRLYASDRTCTGSFRHRPGTLSLLAIKISRQSPVSAACEPRSMRPVTTISIRRSRTKGGCRRWSRTTGSTPSSARRLILSPAEQHVYRQHRRRQSRDRPAPAGLGLVVDRVQPGAGDGRYRRARPTAGLPGRPAVLAADLSVVSAAVPGPAPRHPDPDPGRRPHATSGSSR